jgi:hypothetical protein
VFTMQNLTPRHIEVAESKILGIEQGWYGVKVSGTIMTGPASTHEKCLEAIGLLPDPVVKSPAPKNAVPIHNDHEFSVSSRASALPSMQTVSLYQIGKKRDRTLGEG